ncbi:MAG: NAD-dependent epimerase/dehydratase family protein [Bacteroidales bacterium]
MKIFVTGATGFIGKHLVRKLVSEGCKVTINLYGAEQSPFDDIVSIHRLSEENINQDIDYLKKEVFDGVIHLASLYLTTHSPEQVTDLINTNVRFGTYVLECASQAKIKWFINTGTFWQYYEDKDYSPVNLYAATKQAFEGIAQYYIETNQIRFCTLKLSDSFGPEDTRPKIFNLWHRISKTGESIDMSPGNQLIDISYIDNIVSAFYLLTKHLEGADPQIKNGDVFAVKANKRYSLNELSLIFETITGKKLNINWGARPYRIREVFTPWTKGKCVPDWSPTISIEEGIKKTFVD